MKIKEINWSKIRNEIIKDFIIVVVSIFTTFICIKLSGASEPEINELRESNQRLLDDNKTLTSDNVELRLRIDELNRLNEQNLERVQRINELGQSIDSELARIQESGSALAIYLREISNRISQYTSSN